MKTWPGNWKGKAWSVQITRDARAPLTEAHLKLVYRAAPGGPRAMARALGVTLTTDSRLARAQRLLREAGLIRPVGNGRWVHEHPGLFVPPEPTPARCSAPHYTETGDES